MHPVGTPPPRHRRLGLLAVLVFVASTGAAAAQQPVLPPGTGIPRGLQVVPGPAFDAALVALSRGEYSQAEEIAGREYRGGIRVGSRRWLDSAAIAAIVGECHYELGRFREAVAAYDETLLILAQHADWLLSVRFPAGPLEAAQRPRIATWRKSERGTRQANLPATALIQLSGSDPQDVLQKGGVLSAAFSTTLRPEEIIRALVISLYRRTEILGILSRDGTAFAEVAAALQRRPAPPNHFSQAWIDVALGTALWSQGKPQQAAPLLERGLVVGPGLDHGLTGWGLIVLGRIALDGGNAAAAARLFDEAACAAAEAQDARALEEAFRWAFAAHLAAGTEGVPPSIAAAADWARVDLPVARARLLASAAEALAATNPQAAAARLKALDPALLRGDAGRGAVGAQAAYAAGVIALAAGDADAGSAELERAVTLARRRSPRLHQTALVVERVMAGGDGLSDRQAETLLSGLLADPAPRDFTIDPLGTLAVITTPRQPAFDAWLATGARRGPEAFLAASDAAARSRWLVRQAFGGRRVAIDRLLDADPAQLDAAAAARRAALLARRPDLARLLDETRALRTTLSAALHAQAGAAPAAAEKGGKGADPPLPGAPDDWRAFAGATARRRAIVDQLAAGRDPSVLDFPPAARPDLRERLHPREMILSFHWTQGGLFGALESRDRVALWQVERPAAVQRELGELLRGIGLFEGTAPVPAAHLAAAQWRDPAVALERALFGASRVNLGGGIDDLVIVPDGPLWYLPFELLPVGSGDADVAPRPLRETCRIRVCPTRGLAVPAAAPEGLAGPVGVRLGRRWRGERPGESDWIGARLARSIDRVLPLPGRTPPDTTVLAAALCDTVVILDELAIDAPLAARPLLAAGGERPAERADAPVTFAEWLGAPAKRAACMVVPGVQTDLVEATAQGRGGEELFELSTDLLAAGARRALVSRWRMAGTTSVELIDEFLVGLADDDGGDGAAPRHPAPAARSWQRAVDIVTAEAPDPAAEPRIRADPQAPPRGTDPLLWAGYLVVEPGAASPARGDAAKVAR